MNTRLFVLVPVLLALAAAPAFAQISRPERPYRGLFGGGGGGGSGDYEQSLAASLSLGGGYDGNVLTGTGDYAPSDPTAGQGSTYAQLSGGLSYDLGRERARFSASVSGGTSYFTSLQTQIANGFSTSAGGSFRLSARSHLTASYTAAFSPNYSLGGFSPLQPPPIGQPAIDNTLGARVEDHVSQVGSVGFTQSLTSRVSLTANYELNRSASPSGAFDLRTRTGSASLGYAIGKGLSARLGYRRISNESGPPENRQRYEGDGLDGGVDFSRSISLSRRTNLAFSTGFTTTRSADDSRYDAVGSAVLSYELARTWSSSLNYSRTVQFSDVLSQPVFSDRVSAGISGLPNRRIQVQVGGGGSRGDVGFANSGNAFWNYYATAGTGFALNQFASFNLSYTYYRYRYQDSVALPAGLPNFADRETIMAYVSLWAPIMQRGRRPNASR